MVLKYTNQEAGRETGNPKKSHGPRQDFSPGLVSNMTTGKKLLCDRVMYCNSGY